MTSSPEAPTTEIPAPQIFHYFLVSGEIEYQDSKHNKSPKYLQVSTLYPCPDQGLTANHLGRCQQNLQLAFYRKYARRNAGLPHEITDVVITSVAYLGSFTSEDFMKNTRPVEPAEAATEAAA
jgi:hypothetical protein